MFVSTTTYKTFCLSTLIHFSTPHELHTSQLSTNIYHVLNRYIPEMTNTYTAQLKYRNLSAALGLTDTSFWEGSNHDKMEI